MKTLNTQVFIAESLSARTSSLLIKQGDDVYYKVKSSGLCVSTGTGSTSWYRAINCVSPQIVRGILSRMDLEAKYTHAEIERICADFNHSLQFSPGEIIILNKQYRYNL